MSDSKRVWIRVIQTVGVSLIAYLFPYFEKIISLDILFDIVDLNDFFNDTWWFSNDSYFINYSTFITLFML